ncbi:MAG: hypothetical protein EOO27_13835 [Comamonadaceae bacterium]|nr:MAG: hypothetical protein EOO27_13835 [Comamonadaceae bacterium]
MGSVPGQVIAHLREHGGHISYLDVAKRYGCPRSSVTAIFKLALSHGVVVRHVSNGRAVLALPGYVLPPDADQPPREVLALQRRLARRQAEVVQLQRQVDALLSQTEGLAP